MRMERIWAPWRLEYITNEPPAEGCFFCNAWEARGEERAHLLLARGERAFVIVNRYPYNGGHIMVAPVRHIGEMQEVDAEEAAEIWRLAVVSKEVLETSMNAEGVNVGINQGLTAGAGVRDHLHVHLVPRWNGDTNFMPVLAETKVIPQGLESLWEQLRAAFVERGFA
jgi:ATP adenylyltransferase